MSVTTGRADALDMASYPCAICGSTRSHDVMKKSGVRVADVFHIVACAECAHVYVNPRVADEALASLYDEAYYRGEGFDRTIDYAGSPSKRRKARLQAFVGSISVAGPGIYSRNSANEASTPSASTIRRSRSRIASRKVCPS